MYIWTYCLMLTIFGAIITSNKSENTDAGERQGFLASFEEDDAGEEHSATGADKTKPESAVNQWPGRSLNSGGPGPRERPPAEDDFYVDQDEAQSGDEATHETRDEEVLDWVHEEIGTGVFEDYADHHALLSSLPEDHTIVYPVQVRRNAILNLDTHDYLKNKEGVHYHHTNILLKIHGHKHRLKLALKRNVLHEEIKQKRYLDETTQIIEESTLENCFYQGGIRKQPSSLAVVSTCSGISGILVIDNTTFIIHPLGKQETNESGGGNWTRWPHVVYQPKSSDEAYHSANHRGMWQSFRDLHIGEFMGRMKIMMGLKSDFDVLSAEKVLELGLVADYSLVEYHNGSIEDTMVYMGQLANLMDAVFRDINIAVSLRFMELWNFGDPVTIDRNTRATLHNFLQYRLKNKAFTDLHVLHMLTLVEFDNNEIGMAIPDSICSRRAIGISRILSTSDPLRTVNGILHMLGHELGLPEQQDASCSCSHKDGCLMQLSRTGGISEHALHVSPCSKESLKEAVLGGLGTCLLQEPPRLGSYHETKEVFSQQCGNGRMERGEECDCLSIQECRIKDPCCNPETCLLQPWATCRFGECCENCTILPSSYVCRLSMTECDVPEFCDGLSGSCPANAVVQNGWECKDSESYCYEGGCQTYANQCEMIWGPSARPADEKCYETFNTAGRFNGHCGVNRTAWDYNKCRKTDAGCGLLHCMGGDEEPRLAKDKTFSTTTVNSAGVNYECKILSSHDAQQFPPIGLVQDGSKCGENSVCVSNHCVTLTTPPSVECPLGPNDRICTGLGVCTNEGNCYCHSNYTGVDCSLVRLATTPEPKIVTSMYAWYTPSPMGSTSTTEPPLSSSPATTMTADAPIVTPAGKPKTIWLIIVLSSVAGGALIILGCFMACYRRKASYKPQQLKKKKKRKKKNPSVFGSISSFSSSNSKGSKSREDSGDEVANRIISFGNMPSYRADKIRRVMRKSLGGVSEQSEESETSRLGDRDSTEIKVPQTLPLARPPEKGILKKYPRSTDDLKFIDGPDAMELEPLKSSAPASLQTENEISGSPQVVCEENGESEAMLKPGDDEDECGSCCSCDKKSDISFSDGEDCECCSSDARDQQTQTDPESGGSPAELPRDSSSDSLEGAKNKIIKLKNINELLKQIDEQFNSVLRQTTQGDMSPNDSEELRGSETEADRHFPRNSFYKQSDIEEGYSPPHRSPLLSPNPITQREGSLCSPEPLPSPSGILSPIKPQSPPALPSPSSILSPIKSQSPLVSERSSPFSKGVPKHYRDPLRGPRHTTSTPKQTPTKPTPRQSTPLQSPDPAPPRPPRSPKSQAKFSSPPSSPRKSGSPSRSPRVQRKYTSPPRSPVRQTPSEARQLSPTRIPVADHWKKPAPIERSSSGNNSPSTKESPPKLKNTPPRMASPKMGSRSPKGSPKNKNHSNNTEQKVDPPLTVPYRGGGKSSSIPGSPPMLPKSPNPSSPSVKCKTSLSLSAQSTLEKPKPEKTHRTGISPKSPSFLSKLVDGNLFKRRGSQANDGNSISEGYHSDKADPEEAIIIREIPVKKPVELPFLPNLDGSYTKAPGSPGSPEDIDV